MSRTSLYSVHPGVVMVQKWLEELSAKTGRSLDEWLHFIESKGPKDASARRDWLKTEHGLGTNSAGWLAERSVGKGFADGDPKLYLKAAETYVENMFAGKKAGLRPIYDAALKLAFSLGKDVKACPCTTMVPLYRRHVFAQLKPATLKRLDFGFALGNTKAEGRLISTGGFEKKDRITHRIPLESVDGLDNEVKRWLKTAYDRDK